MLAALLLAAAAALPELQASARQRHLAEAPGWMKLLHYEKSLFGSVRSEAGSGFFLTPDGASQPSAELDAMLAAIVSGDDAVCKFPARTAWLVRELSLEVALPACPRFEEFFGRVAPRSVTAVFSSYFLSSPASAFGHTLLRLDKADSAVSGRHFELLDYGVNYAAAVDTQNALVYAFKGLFGLFDGNFNSIPYYYKVREYNDFESRDLWEYDLSLTPQQVFFLTAHVWELGSTTFPYYYVSRNCSFYLLAALEAAVPELDLLNHVGHVAVPADTIKALYRMPGLVKAVRWRPSIRAQFQRRVSVLSADERAQVAKLSVDPAAALGGFADARSAAVLDAALDLVDLRHARGIILGTDPQAMNLKQRLLERRSAVHVQSEDLQPAAPMLQAPQLGHGSMRAGIGGGGSTQTGGFGLLDYRIALHDLLDPPAGYPELAQLEFADTRLRWNARSSQVWLDHFWLTNVSSIAPMDRFVQPLTWRMRLGAQTLRDAACDGCLAGALEIAGGATVAFFEERLALFAMAESAVDASPSLHGIRDKALRVGVGPFGGARLRLTDSLVMLGTGRWHYLPWSSVESLFELEASARIGLPGGFALGASVMRRPAATEFTASTFLYF